MPGSIRLAMATLICICFTTFAGAQSIPTPLTDPLNGKVVEIETIYGPHPVSETLPRLAFLPNALLPPDLCHPSATARDNLMLVGPLDPSVFGPRPAIECFGLDQDAVNIAYALSRAGHIDVIAPDKLAVMRGNNQIMTLRLLN